VKELLEANVQKMIATVREVDLTNPEVYKWFLAQTYYYSSQSESLLRHFSECAKIPELKKRWLAHADEEAGHENLAMGDLKRMGESIENYPELMETKKVYEVQRKIALESDGIAPFGWALALEGFAAYVDKKLVEDVRNAHGERCAKFIIVHSEEDPDHLESAFKAVELLGDTEGVKKNIELSADIYCEMLRACARMANNKAVA
jgi:pyrroloquinoline quinone (PQQ) biosynthesis protein C